MNAAVPSTPPAARVSRSDGVESRSRLLHTALRLFAEKGFTKTSTREIAQAAGANIAAISYYFGDKAGLYAATFTEPMGGNAGELIARIDAPGLPIGEALRIFMAGYLEPLKHGETVRQCMRLHLREMIEPTMQWPVEFERDIKGPHDALVRLLCRHLALDAADDDVHRLALSLAGMAMQLYVMQDVIDALKPSLLDTPLHIDTWAERLVGYAVALVAAEASRRREVPLPSRRPLPTTKAAASPLPPRRRAAKTARGHRTETKA